MKIEDIKRNLIDSIKLDLLLIKERIDIKKLDMPAFPSQEKNISKKVDILFSEIQNLSNNLKCCGNCLEYSLGKCNRRDYSTVEVCGGGICKDWKENPSY